VTVRIRVDGGELSYEVRGEGSPVVLLHGGALDGRTWDGQFALLGQRHTAVRYDARGHGQSSTPTAPFAHYEDLRQLMTGLGIPRASLVGLSLGARTSIDFALAHPDMVDNLLLVAPGISGMTVRDPFILDQLTKLAEVGAAGDLTQAVECVLRMWVDGPHRAPEEIDQGVRRLCQELITDTLTRHGAPGRGLVTELEAIDRTDELSARILVVVGDLDSSDIHGVADLVERQAPHARKLVIPGVAHMVNLERPEAFNRVLLRFLQNSEHEEDLDPPGPGRAAAQ
jgi:pimeloyl-ACP methyl ester carboxylesterase